MLIGILIGFLSGSGIGGGNLLILWLTAVQMLSIETARLIVLVFFIPCAAVSCLLRLRTGKLPLRFCLPAIISGSISALLFTIISGSWNTAVIRKLWGIILCISAWKELRSKKHAPE